MFIECVLLWLSLYISLFSKNKYLHNTLYNYDHLHVGKYAMQVEY
jgi:hypothetical protein